MNALKSPAAPKLLHRLRERIQASPRARRHLVTAGILGAGIVGAAGLMATASQPEQATREEKAWPVSVATVQPALRSPTLAVFGAVEAAMTSDLKAPVGAPVAAVLVREGDRVAAGDLLIQLDAAELQLTLDQREAEADQARAELASLANERAMMQRTTAQQEALAAVAQAKLERYTALHDRKMVAQTLLDEVRREASTAQIALERHRADLSDLPNRLHRLEALLAQATARAATAQLDLDRTQIHAPFAGPVLSVTVAPGDQVLPGTPLVRLAETASVEVRAPLPGSAAATLRQATGPVLASGRMGDAEVQLELLRLGGIKRDGRAAVDGFFRIVSGAEQVELGRILDLRIELPAQQQVVALPVQAVYENGRVYRVRTDAAGTDRLEALDVELVGETARGADYRLLVRASELGAGDRIITTQLPQPMTGLRVALAGARIAEAPAQPPPTAGNG